MKEKTSYTIIRAGFPQVYRTGDGFMVSARSKRWGLNERPTFKTESEALDYRSQIQASIQAHGAQLDVPPAKIESAKKYEKLVERLTPHGKTPEEAVDHYIKFLGSEIVRQTMPTVRRLVEDWQAYKLLDSGLDSQYRNEIKLHCRYITRTWGDQKAGDIRKNDIDTILKKKPGTNNTRKKYLTFIRMFFNWVLAEDKGYITTNPALGIKFRADGFEKEFYQPDTIKEFLQKIAKHRKELVGYYALLVFAGLRPTEGARVKWHHINFNTNELHVIKGKTDARHIRLEPVAVEWLKWHKKNLPKNSPFVPERNLFNLERKARALMDNWIADGLRHTFATNYTSLKKDYPAVAWYMGNSVSMIKKHYAQTVPSELLKAFWELTPKAVLKKKK